MGTAMAASPIYNAHDYMSKVQEVDNGVLYNVDAEGTELKVMHLYGNAYERGVAQGRLIGDQIHSFGSTGIDNYLKQEVLEKVDKYYTVVLPAWT